MAERNPTNSGFLKGNWMMTKEELAGGVPVFGHIHQGDAVAMLRALVFQELRVMVETLVKEDAPRADMLISLLIDAFADRVAILDADRHERIGRMVRSIMTEDAQYARILPRVTRPEFSIDYSDYAEPRLVFDNDALRLFEDDDDYDKQAAAAC